MPRAPKTPCPCKCGQAPAATVRNRKATCPICTYTVRLSREHIAVGLPACPRCALALQLDCLFDREHLPGEEGCEARAILRHMARGADLTASLVARKAAATRRARETYRAVPVATDGMPF